MVFRLLFIIAIMTGVQQGWAAETGRQAAMKYFTKKSKTRSKTRAPASSGSRLLGISMGTLVNSKSYNWAEEEFSGWTAELTYLSETDGNFGRGLHLEMQKFADQVDDLTKVSFLFSMTFPKRISFPVYVGAAVGPGFFIKQREGESEFSLDYKAYLGLRLNQVNSQYFLQTGVKNHVHVLSDGQFVGWFVSSGVAYLF